ncbi:MAG: TonB-dependent receptor, partial [Acidobacteria bacterium]
LEDVVARGRWTVAPSLRWERRADRFLAGAGGLLPPPAASATEDGLSGKLAVRRALGRRLALRATAGRVYRAPSLLELFGDRGAVVGNPALRPESGTKLEAGVSYETRDDAARRHLSAEIVAFGSWIDDLVVFELNSQSTAVPRNVGRARIAGLEALVTWRGRRLALSASGTLQHAEDRSGGVLDGARLVGRPARLGSLTADWTARRWSARWDVTYVGENPSDPFDTPALRVPARVIHDATFELRLGDAARLALEARNVFDRRTVDVLRFPLPGRVLLVRLRIGPDGDAR